MSCSCWYYKVAWVSRLHERDVKDATTFGKSHRLTTRYMILTTYSRMFSFVVLSESPQQTPTSGDST